MLRAVDSLRTRVYRGVLRQFQPQLSHQYGLHSASATILRKCDESTLKAAGPKRAKMLGVDLIFNREVNGDSQSYVKSVVYCEKVRKTLTGTGMLARHRVLP